VAALQTLNTAQIEVEWLAGDLEAAAKFVVADNTRADRVLHLPIEQLLHECRVLAATGRASEAIARTTQRMQSLSPEQRVNPGAFVLQLTLAESQWAAELRDTAEGELAALLAAMKRENATRNWVYTRATELMAQWMTWRGKADEGLALLQELDRTAADERVPPLSLADRADSAWRRATVLLAAGGRSQAEVLLKAMQTDLQGQHPDSPRRAAARQLAAALSP
jgi:hypothetical protein